MPFDEPWGVKASPTFRCREPCRKFSYSDSAVHCLLYSENGTWHCKFTSVTCSRGKAGSFTMSRLLIWSLCWSCCLQHNGSGRNHCVLNLWRLSQCFLCHKSTYGTHEKSCIGSWVSSFLILSTIGWKWGGNNCKHLSTIPTMSVLSEICSITPRK